MHDQQLQHRLLYPSRIAQLLQRATALEQTPPTHPAPSSLRFYALLALIFSAQLFLAARLAPIDDELYYWCWSRTLQASYFDHPPMTAYLIRASTSIFGDTLLGVRFGACLCSLGTLLLIAQLTGKRGLGFLLVTPVFALGTLLMTPDAPLLFFWAAYAVWLVQMQRAENPSYAHWLLGGLLLGLGGLSKYTMIFALPGAVSSFALAGRAFPYRRFAFHLLVSMVVASPVLLFNYWHDFVAFRYQFLHAAGASDDNNGFKPFRIFEYAGVQIALFGTLPFLLLPWCIAHWRTLAENSLLRICLGLFLAPALFFLLKGTLGRVEGNWPFICYVTLMPLALYAANTKPARHWFNRWGFKAAFAIPLGVTLFVLAHAFLSLPLPAGGDRMGKLQARYSAVAEVSRWAHEAGDVRLYAVNYQMTSQLRFQKVNAEQFPDQSRPSHFTMETSHWQEEPILYFVGLNTRVCDLTLPQDFTLHYTTPAVVAQFPEVVRGEVTALIQF